MMHTDEALMADYSAKGNNDLLGELYNRHSQQLTNFVSKFFRGDMDSSEDAVQAAFVRVQECRQSYNPAQGFRPWLYSIAAHISLNMIRANKRRKALSINQGVGADDAEFTLQIACHWCVPSEQEAMEHETSQAIHDAINQLDAGDQDALRAVYFDGMKFDEAAVSLGIPRGSLTTRVVRSLKSIKRRLGTEDQYERAVA